MKTLCLLAPHSHGEPPFKMASCHLETFVSVSPSQLVVGKEGCPLCSLKLIFQLYAMEY